MYCDGFASPKSFTGEDVVELSCHGGLFILKTALQAVLAAGGFSGGARRIYATGVFERQDGSRAGGGRDGADLRAGP